MSAIDSSIGRAQGDGSGVKDGGIGLSLALGAKASGTLFEEARKEFNPIKETPFKLEAADMPNINAPTRFSQNLAENNKDIAGAEKALPAVAIAGALTKNDTQYSAAAVMSADQKVFGKKANAA